MICNAKYGCFCDYILSFRETHSSMYAHHLNNNVRRKRSLEKENKNQNMLYVDQVANQQHHVGLQLCLKVMRIACSNNIENGFSTFK